MCKQEAVRVRLTGEEARGNAVRLGCISPLCHLGYLGLDLGKMLLQGQVFLGFLLELKLQGLELGELLLDRAKPGPTCI